LKVLLVNPRNARGRNYIIIPNISLGYLSSATKRRGHEVKIVDCVRDNIGAGELGRRVSGQHYDVIGFSVFSTAVEQVRNYARFVKENANGAIVVVGGAHPTFEPEETMEKIRDADFGFCGEAEIGFPRLLDLLQQTRSPSDKELSHIPGLIWRNKHCLRVNPNQLLPSLDLNPTPDWEGLEPDRFPLAPNGVFSRMSRVAPILTTRGCPYECRFCGSQRIHGETVRARSIDNILKEMEWLRDRYRIFEFHFMDDNFTTDREFALRFCKALRDARLNIFWACTSGVRLDTLDEDLLVAMEASGCYSIAVGIESGSDRVLRDMRKHLTTAMIEKKIALIRRYTKMKITGFFIVGYPTETRSDIEKTISLALKLKIHRANFFNFSPFPGSPIYYELKASGALMNLNYDDLYIHTLNYEHPLISQKQLKAFLRSAYLRFYLRPWVLRGVLGEIKSLTQMKIILKRASAILFKSK
jgi:anaerobic magnesium-protoporphyrin IX monomethyl ester cyclase